MKRTRLLAMGMTTLAAILLGTALQAGTVTVGFEEFGLATGTAINDFTASTPSGFTSQGAFFNNTYETILYNGTVYESWTGWALSTVRDVTTPGFNPVTFALQNQFGAYNLAAPVGSGAGGSSHYVVGFASYPGEAYIDLPENASLISMDVTNTTYAALSMLNGDSFAKKFGGISGNDPDYFRLTITGFGGLGATGSVVGAIEVYLADYRGAVNLLMAAWTNVDLTSLAGARSLGFGMDSSDNTDFGGGFLLMNTPSLFAVDNLRYSLPEAVPVPEPSSAVLLALGGVIAAGWLRRKDRRA